MRTPVNIAAMTCQRCVQAVWTSLAAVEGITTAEVKIGRAEIEHDGRATVEAIREAVAVVGYEVQDGTESRRQLPVL